MSAEDISRYLFDPRMHYATVLMQEGRVLTDSDWNEMANLEDEDRRQLISETVCTEGSPNDGFKIDGPLVPFSVNIFPDNPPGPPLLVLDSYDLTLGTGSFYLGGYRFTIDPATPAETFQTQVDWLTRTLGTGKLPQAPTAADLAGGPRTDVVYLMGYEQAVTSIEDQEFRERALGGPDTSVRLRRMRRIAVLSNIPATTCAEARAALRTQLAAPRPGDTGGPHSFDPTGTELLSKARLTVTFPGGIDADPCKPKQVRGFIGAENQAIRVQCTAANEFVWGIDNTAPLHRVQVDPSDPTRQTLLFLTTPRDRASLPLEGQTVEILPWEAVMANGEKAAAMTGFVSVIQTSYNPADDTLVLTTPVPQNMVDWLAGLPAGFENPLDPAGQRRFFFLKVWTGGPPQSFTPNNPVSLTDTGLDVTFSDFAIPGDYWIIAARPNTPDRVVPWRLLNLAPPAGPRLFFTALGMVKWSVSGGAVVSSIQDCRERFRSLCRSNGCCRIVVGDGQESFGDFTSIDDAIKALPPEGGEVCVLNGRYTEAVAIDNKTNILIHGCGRDTVIVAPAGAIAAIEIGDSDRIAIRDLAIEAPEALGILVQNGSTEIILRNLKVTARDRAAILARVNSDLVIEGCDLSADPLVTVLAPGVTAGLEPLLFAAGDRLRIERNRVHVASAEAGRTATGGIQIGGGSTDVEIRRNEILRGNGNGITLGSIHYVTAADANNPDVIAGIDGASGGSIIISGGYVYDPNNCVFVPGDPQDPTDPNGDPLVPVSEGGLYDVRIIDNRIRHMGENGIAVVRLVFPDPNPDMINVQVLLIAENTILECMQLEVGPISPANIRKVAFGGIILAGAELTIIRDNVIEDVGSEHRDQICGMFVLTAIGIEIESNRLRRNGQVAVAGEPLKLGHRGGIIIRFARPPVEPLSFQIGGATFSGERQDGVPAASIHHNVVVAREGRALFLNGLGPMTVTDNQFTAHGSDFLALLGFLISSFAGTSLATGPTTGAASLPPSVSTFDLLLDALGGHAILIFNVGWSNELYLQMLGLDSRFQVQGNIQDDDTKWFIGGNVQFNDNQVVFDALDPVFTLSLCAVLLFTFDDINMVGNQIDCDLAVDFVVVDTLAFGLSVEMGNNRLKEGYFNAYLSAVTFGLFMNSTAHNVSTHCIKHLGFIQPSAFSGGTPVDLRLNLALVDPSGDEKDCLIFQRRLGELNQWDANFMSVGYPSYKSFGGANG
jgi:hypothetical protein